MRLLSVRLLGMWDDYQTSRSLLQRQESLQFHGRLSQNSLPLPNIPDKEYVNINLNLYCYQFIVVINIVTTAVATSSQQEIRQVFYPPFCRVNTDCVHGVPAPCQYNTLIQLDRTGVTRKQEFQQLPSLSVEARW